MGDSNRRPARHGGSAFLVSQCSIPATMPASNQHYGAGSLMVSAVQIENSLKALGNADHAADAQRFFKTGVGEYGEGDQFLGIRVPVLRQQVKQYRGLPLEEALLLLHSPLHEVRLFALLLLVEQFQRGTAQHQADIHALYLANTQYINNWDLVDTSAPYIMGIYLHGRDKQVLYTLAVSSSLWERRIAMIATFFFIRQHQFGDALAIAKLLLADREDLIHKAVGWMLREIGKRDRAVETTFLQAHYRIMPRTMLRYAIEHFSPEERQRYLQK